MKPGFGRPLVAGRAGRHHRVVHARVGLQVPAEQLAVERRRALAVVVGELEVHDPTAHGWPPGTRPDRRCGTYGVGVASLLRILGRVTLRHVALLAGLALVGLGLRLSRQLLRAVGHPSHPRVHVAHQEVERDGQHEEGDEAPEPGRDHRRRCAVHAVTSGATVVGQLEPAAGGQLVARRRIGDAGEEVVLDRGRRAGRTARPRSPRSARRSPAGHAGPGTTRRRGRSAWRGRAGPGRAGRTSPSTARGW